MPWADCLAFGQACTCNYACSCRFLAPTFHPPLPTSSPYLSPAPPPNPSPQQVSGGITMHAFKFELANVYRNLTNVVLRLSPADPVAAAKKAVLVNSHYDSMMGTVGGWVGSGRWVGRPGVLSGRLWLHALGAVLHRWPAPVRTTQAPTHPDTQTPRTLSHASACPHYPPCRRL